MRKPIVIIGGMGPQASLRFHELLVKKSRKYHSGENSDFPFIVHFSLPVEDFISDEKAKNDAAVLLNRLTHTIEQLQPAIVTLACNTAHLLQPKVKLMRSPVFMSMLKAVAARIKNDGIRQVGLLASPTTVRTKLYEAPLSKQGIRTLLPGNGALPILEATIRGVISGADGAQSQPELSHLARVLIDKGAEAILLGCTELPLIFGKATAPVPVYDCLDTYADTVIDRYYLYNGA